jgi:rhodanese-related sulfurtransferase
MKQISYEELEEWRTQGRPFHLLDVREPEEHEAYNIGGELCPLGRLMRRLDELPEDQPLVFYCRKGVRSQIAIQRLLRKRAELDCYNLTGGISQYFE